jgi:poly(A) polymerase/tRNA nucleotidyltransferase (CCA-adding enzyme)
MKDFLIPKEVKDTGDALIRGGFQAYLVGGCVRDLFTGKEPNDWDITTDATPDEIQKLFPESVYENDFGTVGIKTESDISSLKIVEVTTFRIEGEYSDNRHPDHVTFAKTVEEDLARRDFTVNAMAFSLTKKKRQTTDDMLVDPFGGVNDLKKKVIRAVGNAEDRFEEDALRLMRAVRLATQLNFSIEEKTKRAIVKKSKLLRAIAVERIRDEFQKLIMTPHAADGIFSLEEYGLLQYILPELRAGIGCAQNKHHKYTVFEHNVRALEYAAKKEFSLAVRLASLLHDVGKPETKRGKGGEATFYNHEMVGARMAKNALLRLKFSNDLVDRVRHLIRYHMFYYNVGEVSESGVRRFIARVGVENIDDILRVREADRIGSLVPKAFPYKLRHLVFMIEKVRHDPVHPKMLAFKGDDIMKALGIGPGKKIGHILFILLEDVLDDPSRNTKEYLETRVHELGDLSEEDLEARAEDARKKRDEAEEKIEGDMKKRHFVQ